MVLKGCEVYIGRQMEVRAQFFLRGSVGRSEQVRNRRIGAAVWRLALEDEVFSRARQQSCVR